jgi:DNA-binding winged helix-turn-helix (wHTH) protein
MPRPNGNMKLRRKIYDADVKSEISMDREVVNGVIPRRPLRLGLRMLDLHAGELRSPDGNLVPLRRQALKVLLLLGGRAGHVVDKASLMQRVWPTVIVGDDSLVQAVADIRKALGDSEHRWLRTVKRQGYLLLPDDWVSQAEASGVARPEAPALSVAILPVAEAEGSAEARRYADRVVADLTLAIGSGLTGGRVIANEAVQMYRGHHIDPHDIGILMGVRHVVCSNLRAHAGRMELLMVMIDAVGGQQHWAGQTALDRRRSSQAAMNDFVAQAARAILVQMHQSAGERAAQRESRSGEDLAMLGWGTVYRGISQENLGAALQWFEQAVSKDPRSLRGWGGLSLINACHVDFGWAVDPDACRRRALEAAERLEQQYPQDALTVLARSKAAQLRGEWAAALLLADMLVERNAGNPTAHYMRSEALLGSGRFDDCIAAAQQAARLSLGDFRAGVWHGLVATAHFMSARYEEAAHAARLGQAANPHLPVPPLVLAATLVAAARPAEGRAILAAPMARPHGLDTHRVTKLFQGDDLRFLQGRERLIDCLRQIGLG